MIQSNVDEHRVKTEVKGNKFIDSDLIANFYKLQSQDWHVRWDPVSGPTSSHQNGHTCKILQRWTVPNSLFIPFFE